jgi:UDP-N-acetylglucosamine acyltransferase
MARCIAETAAVDPRAEIADEVFIGPFSVIGPKVSIGKGTRIENNVTLTGRTTLGEDNHVYPNTVIGAEPQDVSYRGSDTQVVLGSRNIIRESVTINRATEKEDGVTILGDDCYLMANCHVAHDCKLGSRVMIANATLLGGHVHIHDDASLSGGIAVHHYTTIGSFSFTGGLSRVLHDIPPFMLCEGSPARARCVNVIGLRRHDFLESTIEALHEAYRLIYRSRVGLEKAHEALRSMEMLTPTVNQLLGFLQNQYEGRNGRGRERRRAA